jgi:CBS domain-containing protein
LDTCVVVNDERIVLGRLRGRALDGAADTPVEDVMEPGPATVRPDEALKDIANRLRDRHVDGILVTTPDGRLVGFLTRSDAEDTLAKHGHDDLPGG